MDENQRTLAVEAVRLRKSFGTVRAVDGVDLTVRAGEIVAFLGPNGAGKTTTIDMLLGLSDPDGGTVRVFGETPRGAVSHGLVSAVLQTGGLLKDITVRETLALTASLFADTRPLDEVMRRAGISELADRRAEAISAVQALRPLEFVNGGGTGSIERTVAEDAITEVAVGSGLFGPHLFDNYRAFTPAPAVAFALDVVRRPNRDTATLLGGGWIASAEACPTLCASSASWNRRASASRA